MKDRDSKEHYECFWGKLERAIEDLIQEGMTDPVAVVNRVFEIQFSNFIRQEYQQFYYSKKYTANPTHVLGVEANAYKLFAAGQKRESVVDRLVDIIKGHQSQFDAVVELGSGPGRQLFNLADRLRNDGVTSIKEFHACEYTDAGLRITDRLNQLGEQPAVVTHKFDYRKPQLSFLDGTKNVLFFTAHSLEQVTYATDDFIEEMIAQTANCYCYHFEPVGWQLDPALAAWRERKVDMGSDSYFERLLKKMEKFSDKTFGTKFDGGIFGIRRRNVKLGASKWVSRNAARWSARSKFNQNLAELLKTMERRGKIEITFTDLNTFGNNPFNPTTMIGWKKR